MPSGCLRKATATRLALSDAEAAVGVTGRPPKDAPCDHDVAVQMLANSSLIATAIAKLAAALRAGFDAGPAADYVVHVADASSLDPLDEASDAALLAVAWLQLYLVREKDRTTGPRARALWVDE